MNGKQLNFIEAMREHAFVGSVMNARSFTLLEMWQEDFLSGKPNALDIVVLDSYGFTYTNLQQYANQNLVQFQNFWKNSAVATAEYGKFARVIMNTNKLVTF